MVLIGLFAAFWVWADISEEKRAATPAGQYENLYWASREAVKSVLKDPKSAKFGAVRIVLSGQARIACGSVNSRNSFGGYTGMIRFISNGTSGATFLEEGSLEEAFSEEWAKRCTGNPTVLTKAAE